MEPAKGPYHTDYCPFSTGGHIALPVSLGEILGYIGITEKKMETTEGYMGIILGLYRVGLGA